MLNAGWTLRDFAPGGGLAAGAQDPTYSHDDWLPIAVPGDVHRTLLGAGRIPDPFYDRNELACAWMEEREWWYRLRFDPVAPPEPGERVQLVFHGLDTFATIWLNGEQLGRHANMFSPAVFDVTNRLQPNATNTLALCFHPPLQMIDRRLASTWGRNPERAAMRKAQFGYGWDWGPRLPTIGIWRPVELRRQREAAIRGVHVATVDLAPGHQQAALAVRVETDSFAAAPGTLSARVRLQSPSDGNGAAIEHRLAFDGEVSTAYLEVDRPRLWWTHDLGQPALYDLDVTLERDGRALDRFSQRVGIRTLGLDQAPDPDEWGTRFFRFVLNGVPIFARGANWIPCDSFVGAISAERYAELLRAARDANMTMLRVWGGGIYEHDAFYDACDRLGILVWQDFMFACAAYPEQDPTFVAEVEAEARYQVARLRSHPSLALWCGNNENQWLHERRFWDVDRDQLPAYGALFYDRLLPKVVAELDGHTPYWPGSPYGGNDHNSREDGDVHNWEVWHGNRPRHFGEPPQRNPSPDNVSFRRYADDLGRFISEFGLHAAPALETLHRCIPPDQLVHHSPAMDWHTKDEPKNKGDTLMAEVTGLPSSLEEYVQLSQLAQAEGLKFGVEHFRRRKPHCSGALVWQLNDCWPGTSWSVLDYDGIGKASYFYLRRAFAPLLGSFKPLDDGSVEVWITNDSLAELDDTLVVRLATFSGETLWQERWPVRVPANTSQRVRGLAATDLDGRPDRFLGLRSATDRFPPNRHFFAAIKDLDRPVARPEMVVATAGPRALAVRLRAPASAYVLFAHLVAPDAATQFSDNFFDLEAGEERVITVSHPRQAIPADQLRLGYFA